MTLRLAMPPRGDYADSAIPVNSPARRAPDRAPSAKTPANSAKDKVLDAENTCHSYQWILVLHPVSGGRRADLPLGMANDSLPNTGGIVSRQQIVDRAEAFIKSHIADPIAIAQLCRVTG